MASLTNNAWASEMLGGIAAPVGLPVGKPAGGRPGLAPLRVNPVDLLRCRVIWRLVTELFVAACGYELPEAMARRRPRCHMRQIAMYLSHVVLSLSYQTIAAAFGRDRTTVMHSCAVIEDRRDDRGYDRFIERCERCIMAVFQPFGQPHAGR
ncbi:transposase [Hoeflea sp. G2-23]|uniref:Transposase n=1 Tax=Hoeflea algicola TaxID=2983763 RepID=A0ABT3Z3G4_9HYPH|nr:helix-turn-helix domain-containing protein [Hoeflea algicola]MCY0146306.1 transposase [Hoeflea algicola]